jgi:hypothetical protein
VHGQEQDLDLGIQPLNFPGGFQAPQVGHGDVEDDQGGWLLFQDFQEFEAVIGFPHHLETVHLFNDFFDALPKQHVIIGQDDGVGVIMAPRLSALWES